MIFFIFIGFCLTALMPLFILSLNPGFTLSKDSALDLMFFATGGGEKTEKPSHKKLQDARKKGQVVKSTDVNNMIVLIGSFLLLTTFGGLIIEDVKKVMEYFFINSAQTTVVSLASTQLFMLLINLSSKVLILIFIPLMLMGVVGNLMQTGLLTTGEPLKPKFNKLNPINGFKEMFSRKRMLGSFKNILLLVVASLMSYTFISNRQQELLSLPYMLYTESLVVLGRTVSNFVIQILLLVVVVAAIDYGIQRFEFMKSMKMSKQELKEEYKQMEGDPFVKGKRRQKQREMSMGRTVAAVSEATVVITNPTHFAVAIKYVHEEDLIPKVVAKGVDFKAQKIKEVAKEQGVPIIENKPLARNLYATVEVDQAIPIELYKAVAEILAIVYKLENKKGYQ